MRRGTGGSFWSGPGAEWFFIFCLSFFSFLLRLWPLLAISQSWEDAYFYIELARSLARGKYELLGVFHTKYLPGYPLAVLVVHTAGFGLISWFKSAQLVSAVSSALIPGACWLLVREAGESREAALAAALTAALNAHLVTFGGVPFSDALFTLQLLAVLLLLRKRPVLGGLVAGWAAITRFQGVLLAAVFVLALGQEWRELIVVWFFATEGG